MNENPNSDQEPPRPPDAGCYPSMPPIGTVVYLKVEETQEIEDDEEISTAAVIVRTKDGSFSYVYIDDLWTEDGKCMCYAAKEETFYKTQADALRAGITTDREWYQAQLDAVNKLAARLDG